MIVNHLIFIVIGLEVPMGQSQPIQNEYWDFSTVIRKIKNVLSPGVAKLIAMSPDVLVAIFAKHWG